MRYSEEGIERRLLAGDPVALGQVIQWIAGVLATPRFWPLRSEWADLHQEILVRVIESLRQERFDPGRDLRVYVQALARYTAFEALESILSRPANPGPPRFARQTAPEAEDRAVHAQFARLVMDWASPECRDLIRAYFYEQRDYGEIARARGIPEGTVKSRLSRCLARIHAALRGARQRRRSPATGRSSG